MNYSLLLLSIFALLCVPSLSKIKRCTTNTLYCFGKEGEPYDCIRSHYLKNKGECSHEQAPSSENCVIYSTLDQDDTGQNCGLCKQGYYYTKKPSPEIMCIPVKHTIKNCFRYFFNSKSEWPKF